MANSGIHGFPLKATPVLADELGLVDSADAWSTARADFTSLQTLMLTNGLVTTALTFPNTGLHIFDTNGSHDLIIKPGSDLSIDRTLTVTTGDADRTITLSGNPTMGDWFDQSVKSTTSPDWLSVGLTDDSATYQLYLVNNDTYTQDRTLNINTSDFSYDLNIAGNITFSADFATSGADSLTFTTTAATNVTLPTTGTLATTDNLAFYLPLVGGTLSGELILTNTTSGIRTTAGVGTLNFLQVYDTADVTYRTMCTITVGGNPTVAWSQPGDSVLTWDGGAIGGTTPAAGTFTALKETTSFTHSRTGTAVSANAVSTITGVTSNAAARTITLLTADCVAGRIKIIKDEAGTAASSNNITIDTQGTELIDGVASITITANFGVARLYPDGTNWFTF